jgi:hypothetical protein
VLNQEAIKFIFQQSEAHDITGVVTGNKRSIGSAAEIRSVYTKRKKHAYRRTCMQQVQ